MFIVTIHIHMPDHPFHYYINVWIILSGMDQDLAATQPNQLTSTKEATHHNIVETVVTFSSQSLFNSVHHCLQQIFGVTPAISLPERPVQM